MIFCSKKFSLSPDSTVFVKRVVSRISRPALALAAALSVTSAIAISHAHANDIPDNQSINEVIVHADFRGSELQAIPASISIVDAASINQRGR